MNWVKEFYLDKTPWFTDQIMIKYNKICIFEPVFEAGKAVGMEINFKKLLWRL